GTDIDAGGIGVGYVQTDASRPPLGMRQMVLAWRHGSLHKTRKSDIPGGRRRGSDRGRSSLPSGITPQRVTRVVVAGSRDHTHRRARSTKVLAVTSNRSLEGHHRTLLAPSSFMLWAAKQLSLLTGRISLADQLNVSYRKSPFPRVEPRRHIGDHWPWPAVC